MAGDGGMDSFLLSCCDKKLELNLKYFDKVSISMKDHKGWKEDFIYCFLIFSHKDSLNIKFTYSRNGPLEFLHENRSFADMEIGRVMKFYLPLNI